MKASSRSMPTRRHECFYRYLKPGALAELRNSKISARSQKQKPISLTQLSAHQVDSVESPTQISVMDQVPRLLSKICGPHCLKRKKLMAARSVFFLNLAPSNPVLESNTNNTSNDSLISVQ
ncbi:hypothetical protein JCGZ_00895 [Jatropha curcas]|uniref:Uncharacterized protein n=1 Tax=Jatropha curcas TaxID=180498 RepID=A0A067KVY0_JATCU|nr:hypothetical protein JCGZ_00895 [Jatropha curcas]